MKCIKLTKVCQRVFFVFLKIQRAYNLGYQRDLDILSVSTESYGKNSLKYFGPIIWNSVPDETFTEFQKETCKWKIDTLTCKPTNINPCLTGCTN